MRALISAKRSFSAFDPDHREGFLLYIVEKLIEGIERVGKVDNAENMRLE